MTKFNPNDAGKAFNENPHRAFYDVTEEQKAEALRKRKAMIEHTRQQLGQFTQLSDEGEE